MRPTVRLPLQLCAALAALPASVEAQRAERPNPTYDAVVQGMSCRQRQSGQMDCEYLVGKSLRFVISGVSQADATVTFYKVDSEQDYYAGVTALHGCVVVKPARNAGADTVSHFAFVSPRDGKAYRDWQNCHKATKPQS
jgi:hypothetical protein